MDIRNLFDAAGSIGTSNQPQDIALELQELRKRRCSLAGRYRKAIADLLSPLARIRIVRMNFCC